MYQEINLSTLKNLFNELSEKIQRSYYRKKTAFIIKKAERSAIGSYYINFTAEDFNGNEFTLSDYKGKYILLDFWASWCVPCRQLNPHLKQLFNNYHKKGLVIISISSDQDHNSWKKAVKKDGIDL